ncbi:MAG TPA: hypothetical protein PK655_00505 [archaeon]|jgi:hypothetical protein|nr:hypothetical protein [archaeon]HPV65922.1 hypothetical protein [archaeon]
MRKIFIFAFLVLMCGAVFADFYVGEIIAPKVVLEDTNFDVNVVVVNNSSVSTDVNLRVEVYNPKSDRLFDVNYNTEDGNPIHIGANDSNNILVNITISDTNASTAQHLIRATVLTPDERPTNNSGQVWFMIKQAQKNVPVPDMPIYFGFIIAFIAIVFLTNREEKK